jgi:cytochrome c
MEFFTQHIIPSSAEHLKLLEFLAVVTYAIHLPYMALLIGSTAVAMWLTFSDHEIPNPRFARLAEDLIQTFLTRRIPMLVLGVLPILVLPFIYAQWFVGAALVPLQYLFLPIPGVIVGLALLVLYARSFTERATNYNLHMGLGTLGVGLLKVSYLVLLATVARFHDPEKWFRIKDLVILLLNWNVIYKFLFFMHLAFAITGAAILFFLFRWSNRGLSGDPDYATFARRFGAGLGLAFCFALPVFNLLYVFTSPDVVFDSTVYLLATAVTFVCMITAYAFIASLRSRQPRYGATTFTLFILVFVLSGTFDLRAMANANREHARLLGQAAEAKKLEREAQIEQAIAAASGKNLGEETFTSVCMQCHRMNEKLVGPPLATVLPKYNVETLKAFVSNPTKQNPDYPPMPNPGLSPAQVDAVAAYVLGQLQGAAPPTSEAPPAETEVKSGQTSH